MDSLVDLIFNELLSFEFKNELQAMALIDDLLFAKVYLETERANISKDSAANLTIKSINLREQGNKLFKVSPSKNALTAAKYYTKAIFAAPVGSEALALAHANRAMALQKFGYFSQAYDDCTCALEQGYPMHMQHKIIMRQGYCALQLGDVALLKQHLDALNELTSLNENFAADVQKLQKGLDELQLKKENVETPEQQIALYRDKVKISKSSTKGRFMVASKPIKQNELIFGERASSFIPLEGRLICQQCASTQLIPFPCYRCSGKVIYCSVKCRKEHAITHGYECMGYQMGLFPSGDPHLALRVILDGIQQVIPFLRSKRTTEEIWHELTDKDSELLQKEHLEYVQVLRRVTHLDKKSEDSIHTVAMQSGLILEYLRKFTNFFYIFKDTAATRSVWELVIGSLIMRHIGQNSANVIECGYIKDLEDKEPFDFELLDDNLWDRPLLVRRGSLHQKFTNIKAAFTANYTYHGLMNHSCESSVDLKFMGRCLSAFAVKDIQTSEEITINYIGDGDILPKQSHKKRLTESFHFECGCSKCTKENQDEIEIHHRYRCEYSKCRSIFTPIVSDSSLKWWEFHGEVRCSKCNNMQINLLNSFAKIMELQKSVLRPNSRMELFKTYKNLDRWLLDNHLLKFLLGRSIIENCLAAYNAGSSLSKKDFAEIIQMSKTLMSYDIMGIDYARAMSYLWDLIALKKYKCSPEEMQEMLKKIYTLPYELEIVCMNYYHEYIQTEKFN